MSSGGRITEVTLRRIVDTLTVEKIWWWGALNEMTFLDRLYQLDELPSTYGWGQTVRDDIGRHCLNNDDWPAEWVFSDERFGLQDDDPKPLLRFLAEMLHPAVLRDRDQALRLVGLLNDILAGDGFELYPIDYISGLPVYGGGQRASFHGARPDLQFDKRPLLTDPRVLHEHQQRIRAGLEADPAATIGACKELIESLCKIILEKEGVTYKPGDDLPQLFKRVSELLGLNAEAVPDNAKASGTVRLILRTLSTTVQGLAELRNQLGLGHGRSAPSPALNRHARLALNSTVSVTEFVLDTWQDRVERGTVQPAVPAPGSGI